MPVEYFNSRTGGAVTTVNLNVGRELAARGHEVVVVTAVDEHEPYRELPVIPIPYAGDRMPWVLRKVVGLHRRWRKFSFQHYGAYLLGVRVALRR